MKKLENEVGQKEDLISEYFYLKEKCGYHFSNMRKYYTSTEIFESIDPLLKGKMPKVKLAPLDFECDSFITSAKRLVNCTCRIILQQNGATTKTLQTFELTSFFNSLNTQVSTKIRNLCGNCGKEYMDLIKEDYLIIKRDHELCEWLLKEYSLWIKEVNNLRTRYEHKTSKRNDQVYVRWDTNDYELLGFSVDSKLVSIIRGFEFELFDNLCPTFEKHHLSKPP
ncbi:MAG: hypothetical protein ABII22_00945 [Candidatus Micrarchaeota archaeon]